MTVTTMETNIDEVQEAEMAILSVNKDGKKNMRPYQISNAEVTILSIYKWHKKWEKILWF